MHSIIDLQKHLKMFREASRFVTDISGAGKNHSFCRHQTSGPGSGSPRGEAAAVHSS